MVLNFFPCRIIVWLMTSDPDFDLIFFVSIGIYFPLVSAGLHVYMYM